MCNCQTQKLGPVRQQIRHSQELNYSGNEAEKLLEWSIERSRCKRKTMTRQNINRITKANICVYMLIEGKMDMKQYILKEIHRFWNYSKTSKTIRQGKILKDIV